MVLGGGMETDMIKRHRVDSIFASQFSQSRKLIRDSNRYKTER